MVTHTEAKFQIGKNGLNAGALTAINNSLKTHRRVRISVLKSCCRDKTELKALAESLISKTEKETKYRLIGYTIILIKQ
jgi:RNA-binding protein YhbY